MKKIQITKDDTTLTILTNNLKYEVVKSGFSWASSGRRAHIVFQKKMFGKYLWIPKTFSSAGSIKHTVIGDSIESEYANFRVLGKKLSLRLIVTACILDDGKVDFAVEARDECGVDIKAVYFPQAFDAKKSDKNNNYSVEPMRQGFILPDTHKKNRMQIFLLTKYWRKVNTGDAYMPVWGRVCGERGCCGIIDKSFDCTLFSSYGKKKAFLTTSNWIGSLGKLDYKRTIHYHFYDKCDYVTFAKEFRAQEIRQGNLITIDDKIKANSNVGKLVGTPIIHWATMENNVPESGHYQKTKIGEVLHNTFAQTAEQFTRFKSLGLDSAYVHLDGWGIRGYDNLHPYCLPPGEKAGGFDGMKALSDTCGKIGYVFGIHDQYRDYYQDSEVYNPEHCVVDVNGKKSFCDYWSGGPHNWLCSSLAMPHIERTYREFRENDVKIEGTYLDVFGIMWGDECYHSDHRITRQQSIEYRGECFKSLSSQGLIVCSEEMGCQTVKYLDLVHHSPYAVSPQERGVGLGIAIPFANLVYHDCVFVPWVCEGIGGWGIPDGDSSKLHCILNGQTPYFSATGKETDDELIAKIKLTDEVAGINKRVYNAEMVSHEFLGESYRKQKTTFSNGYEITVDFDKDTYSVSSSK